jgi:hypothetical protein
MQFLFMMFLFRCLVALSLLLEVPHARADTAANCKIGSFELHPKICAALEKARSNSHIRGRMQVQGNLLVSEKANMSCEMAALILEQRRTLALKNPEEWVPEHSEEFGRAYATTFSRQGERAIGVYVLDFKNEYCDAPTPATFIIWMTEGMQVVDRQTACSKFKLTQIIRLRDLCGDGVHILALYGPAHLGELIINPEILVHVEQQHLKWEDAGLQKAFPGPSLYRNRWTDVDAKD